MKLKINWQKPKTELDNVILTMLLWYDIWKNNYLCKEQSKYYTYVEGLWHDCPLCDYYFCDCYDKCFLPRCNSKGNPYVKWLKGRNIDGAKKIYLLCKAKAKGIINNEKTKTHI